MEKFFTALTGLVARGSHCYDPSLVRADLSDAPPCIQDLAKAMANHVYNVELGPFRIASLGGGVVSPLTDLIQNSIEEAELNAEEILADFVPAKTLQIGPDGGGLSVLGATWTHGKPELVIVELDAPTPDTVVVVYPTAEAFFTFLRSKTRGDDSADVAALAAACLEPAE